MYFYIVKIIFQVFKVEQDNVMEECLSISSLLAGQTDFVRCQATILRQLLLKGSFVEGDTQMLEERAREDSYNNTSVSF